jgi:hypothetical protein
MVPRPAVIAQADRDFLDAIPVRSSLDNVVQILDLVEGVLDLT